MPEPRSASAGTQLAPPRALPTTPAVRRAGAASGVALVVAMAAVAIVVAGLVVPSAVGPGFGVIAVGLSVALAFSALNSPVLAVLFLLVATFLRPVLRTDALPIEPFLIVFAGVLTAAVVAVARRVHRAPRFGPVEAVMAMFLLWNIGSAIAPHTYPAVNPRTDEPAFEYHFILISTLLPFTLYVVGRFIFEREKPLRRLLWTVVALAAYSIWVSIMAFHAPGLVWPRYIVELTPDDGWYGRAVGVFAQPVANGILLVTGFVIMLYLATHPATQRWQRALLWALAAASMYAIYLTYTRAVWLTFGIVLILGAFLLPRVRTVLVTLILIIVLAIGLNWATFSSGDRSAGGVGSANEVGDRLNMIATAWWAIKEQPVAGWGIARFIPVNTYHHQQWSSDVDWIRGYGISSHENEIGIAAELGVIGLVLWLTILVLLARRLVIAVRTLPKDDPDGGRDIAAVALLAFLIWIAAGLTADLRFFDFANMLVMLLVGIAVGYLDRYQARRPDVPAWRRTDPGVAGPEPDAEPEAEQRDPDRAQPLVPG